MSGEAQRRAEEAEDLAAENDRLRAQAQRDAEAVARLTAALAADASGASMRMDAYYYGFAPTGVPAIDRILSAVACAGKAFHHTDQWNCEVYGTGPSGEKVARPYEPFLRGMTPVEWIQNAALDAAAQAQRDAEALERLTAALAAAEAARDLYVTKITELSGRLANMERGA